MDILLDRAVVAICIDFGLYTKAVKREIFELEIGRNAECRDQVSGT